MGIVSQGSSDHVCPLGPLTLLGARFPLYAGERDDVGWVTGWGLIVEGPGWDLYGPGGCGGLVEVTGEEVTLGRGYNAVRRCWQWGGQCLWQNDGYANRETM